jgi:hypothetical protein
VRQFAVQVCANASLTAGQSLGVDVMPTGLPPDIMNRIMANELAMDTAAGDIHDILKFVNANYQTAWHNWGQWQTYIATTMYNMYEKQMIDRGTGDARWNLVPGGGAVAGTVDHIRGVDPATWPAFNFAEFCAASAGGSSSNGSAQVTMTDGGNAWTVNYTYAYAGVTVSFQKIFNWWGADSGGSVNEIKSQFAPPVAPNPDDETGEWYQYLNSTFVAEFDTLYPGVKVPTKADESHLPIGTKDPSTGYGGGPYSSLPFSSGLPIGDVPNGSGLADPTHSYGTDPFGGGTGSLAGYDPSSLGGGLYTPGAASGLDGGGLSAPGAGLAGSGVAGAGAAGRAGMPMIPPGAGMGQGGQKQDRQRGSWLPEDEDVWGANSDASDPVL